MSDDEDHNGLDETKLTLNEIKRIIGVSNGPNMEEMTQMFREMMLKLEENRLESERRLTTLMMTKLDEIRSDETNEAAGGPLPFQVMPDLTGAIGKFYGTENDESAKEWLEKMKSMALLHHWPDNFALETARINLKGAAEHWYAANRQEITNWNEFKTRFTKTFMGKLTTTEKWERMRKRIQGPKENISEYFHEKYRLCKALQLDFDEIKEQILKGLRNRDVICALLAKNHCDSDELLADLKTFLKVKDDKTFGSENRGNSAITSARRNDSVGTPSVKCFNCGERDHKSNTCPKNNPVCFTCKKEGHISKECPDKKKKTQDKSEDSSNKMSKRKESDKDSICVVSDGQDPLVAKFLKEIEFNGVKEIAFIDTGSAVCIIREDVVYENQMTMIAKKQALFGFGGSKVETLGAIVVDVKLDNLVVEKVEFLVVPEKLQTYKVLVGRSLTEREEIAYLRKGDHFIFGYSEETPFKDLQLPEEETKVQIVSTKDQTIGPGEVHFVQVSINDNPGQILFNHSETTDIKLELGQVLGRITLPEVQNIECEAKISEISRDMVKIDPSASEEQCNQLMDLVKCYRDCFALTIDELGCTNLMSAEILDSGVPVQRKPYKTNAADRAIISETVREWKRCGIVTETTSPYASPVLLVGKKDGTKRLVVDYRALNSQSVRINYPIPEIDEQFHQLHGCKLFTVLDLANGYLQIPLTEESKAKTAFITQDETGQFERLVFGLKNAPFQFVRLMHLVLGRLRNNVAMCYLDDILIPAKTWNEMREKLKSVLHWKKQT